MTAAARLPGASVSSSGAFRNAALRAVDFATALGEVVGLEGANGAGRRDDGG